MDDSRELKRRVRMRVNLRMIQGTIFIGLGVIVLLVTMGLTRGAFERLQWTVDLAYCLPVAGLGAVLLLCGPELPVQEVVQFARMKKGVVSLSEMIGELEMDPNIAERTLKRLQKQGVAVQCWQEFRKNLWEFPDYLEAANGTELVKAGTLGVTGQEGGIAAIAPMAEEGGAKSEERGVVLE